MNTVPLKKVTIISEAVLEPEILRMVKELGARGYTTVQARGEGSRGVRASEWEGHNVMVEVLVDAATADRILGHVAEHYFEHYAVVAYLTDVRVVRGGKYTA
ncbi:P-II family nitrogen regulator [Longimicrobium sp.]|jgi:nitrogen regulatory protein PII|uniref:P-II family nitrogen regulator n=1 Tax=Longimicrobium sp. TaxID=2029185 RepID=UPI002ED9A846